MVNSIFGANMRLLCTLGVLSALVSTQTQAAPEQISSGEDSRYEVQSISEDGRYVLVVKDRFTGGGMRHNYVASVEENKPSFSATVAVSSFSQFRRAGLIFRSLRARSRRFVASSLSANAVLAAAADFSNSRLLTAPIFSSFSDRI